LDKPGGDTYIGAHPALAVRPPLPGLTVPNPAPSPHDASANADALSLTLSRAAEAAAGWPLAEANARVVLLIEDNADHRYVYAQVLSRAGFRVEEAGTGAEGLARARALRPDVVLVDVMLPDTDGWQVMTALKADPATAAIPVLVVSVRAFAHDHARSLAAGAARHLDKPAAPYAVVDAVCALLPPRDDVRVGAR
jgi:CheY-like chemotaxis protein